MGPVDRYRGHWGHSGGSGHQVDRLLSGGGGGRVLRLNSVGSFFNFLIHCID